MPDLPLLDRLKIVSEFIVPLLAEVEAELGTDRAHALFRRGAARHFRRLAREAVRDSDGDPFQALALFSAPVRHGLDLQAEVRVRDDGFDMDVTDCAYARFFRELGRPELGFLLACQADFDLDAELPDLRLERSQTIMQGADSCDFRYRRTSGPDTDGLAIRTT